jgi:nucleotide-binding universal stress UspA family protein
MSEVQTGTAADAILRDTVRDALGTQAGDVDCRTVAGLPGRALVGVARDVAAELLVLTSRGDAAMARVLGAVSQHVLRNAPCPVLVVPDGTRDRPPRGAAAAASGGAASGGAVR